MHFLILINIMPYIIFHFSMYNSILLNCWVVVYDTELGRSGRNLSISLWERVNFDKQWGGKNRVHTSVHSGNAFVGKMLGSKIAGSLNVPKFSSEYC